MSKSPTFTGQVREVFHQDTPAQGQRLAAHLIESLPACPIPEIARLGRTLRKWKDAFLAYFDTGGASNGPTEAINGHYRAGQTHRQRLPQPHQLPTPNAPHRRRPRRLHPHSTRKSPIIDELAQASDTNPLTRVLADAALLDLDRYVTGAGLRYSRVGTTLMLAAPSEQCLAEAIDAVAVAAINAGARVTDLTTQHIDEEKALASVGIDPWTSRPGDEPTGQADRILYVGRDGARVHVKAGRVLVDAPGSLPATSVPKNSVTRIVLSGNVGLSAGVRSWTMRGGVDVVCLSRRGSYQGTLIGSNRGTRASRLLAQVTLTGDHERRVRLAASLIGAKIRGQIHVLTRIARRDETVHVADTTAHMHAWRRSLAGARTLDEVMGIEGACSNAYFDALGACVPADVTFDGRSRRPPRDLPNAALSYGYAILLSECVGALHAAGLEPSLGVAHAPTDKRPSLALDLIEQFRPLLVDQTAMALLRTRKLRPEHGVVEAEAGGIWLSGDGKKILVDTYEAACQRSVTGALPGYSGSWRRHIAHSVQMLARAIAEPDYQWSGVAWR